MSTGLSKIDFLKNYFTNKAVIVADKKYNELKENTKTFWRNLFKNSQFVESIENCISTELVTGTKTYKTGYNTYAVNINIPINIQNIKWKEVDKLDGDRGYDFLKFISEDIFNKHGYNLLAFRCHKTDRLFRYHHSSPLSSLSNIFIISSYRRKSFVQLNFSFEFATMLVHSIETRRRHTDSGFNTYM
jgi:hypothetical protein